MSGFTAHEVQALEHIKDSLGELFTHPERRIHRPTAMLYPEGLVFPIEALNTQYVLESFYALADQVFRRRFVIGTVELGFTHLLCETQSYDGRESFYFDERHHSIAHANNLIGYTLKWTAPWNRESTLPAEWKYLF